MDKELLPIVALLAVLITLAAAELAAPLHASPRDAEGRIATNFTMGAINLGLVAIVPVSGVVAAGWADMRGIGLLNWIGAPATAAFAATLVLRSLAAYCFHRLAHAVPAFWRLHRVHHTDVAVDISTGFRTHPGELAILLLLSCAVAIAIGASPAAWALYEAVAFGVVMFSHSNLALPERLDSWLGRWLATPGIHHVHHSSERDETDSNFGEVLIVWDRIFGTYRAPPRARLRETRFGLGDTYDSDAGRIRAQLSEPFRRSD